MNHGSPERYMMLGGASAIRGDILNMNKCKVILFCLLVMLLLSACTAPASQKVNPTPQSTGYVTAAPTTVPPTEPTTIKAAVTVKSETVKIDGVLYRNNFQGNLVFRDPKYDSKPVFEKGANRYFRLDCEQYDLLYNVNVREVGVGESVYCRDDQWQQLYDYYTNLENFTYHCWYDEYGPAEHVLYPVPTMDTAKLDALVAFCECNSYDPYGSNSGVKTRRVPYAVSREPELRFGKLSKDGLYSEGAARFFMWKGKLLFELYTYSDDYMLVADVPDDLSHYFIAIVNAL